MPWQNLGGGLYRIFARRPIASLSLVGSEFRLPIPRRKSLCRLTCERTASLRPNFVEAENERSRLQSNGQLLNSTAVGNLPKDVAN
jgi:hypothetical protein